MAGIFSMSSIHGKITLVLVSLACLSSPLQAGANAFSPAGISSAKGPNSSASLEAWIQECRFGVFEHPRVTLGIRPASNTVRLSHVFVDNLEQILDKLKLLSGEEKKILSQMIGDEKELASTYVKSLQRDWRGDISEICSWRRIHNNQFGAIRRNEFRRSREALLSRIYSTTLSLIAIQELNDYLVETRSKEYCVLLKNEFDTLFQLLKKFKNPESTAGMSSYEELLVRSLQNAAILLSNRACNKMLRRVLLADLLPDCDQLLAEYVSGQKIPDLSWIRDPFPQEPPHLLISKGADYDKIENDRPIPFCGSTSRLLRFAALISEFSGKGEYKRLLASVLDPETPPEKKEFALYRIREHYLNDARKDLESLRRVAKNLDVEDDLMQGRLSIYLWQIIWMVENPQKNFNFRHIEEHLPQAPEL